MNVFQDKDSSIFETSTLILKLCGSFTFTTVRGSYDLRGSPRAFLVVYNCVASIRQYFGRQILRARGFFVNFRYTHSGDVRTRLCI